MLVAHTRHEGPAGVDVIQRRIAVDIAEGCAVIGIEPVVVLVGQKRRARRAHGCEVVDLRTDVRVVEQSADIVERRRQEGEGQLQP